MTLRAKGIGIDELPRELQYHEEPEAGQRYVQQVANNPAFGFEPEYRNLCETVTRKVELNNDPTYDYQPPHYYEVFCKSYSTLDDEPHTKPDFVSSRQKCAHPSFHCVQRSRTLFIMRRRWDNEFWEPLTKVVVSRCDCMWPVSTLGDVSIHYSTA